MRSRWLRFLSVVLIVGGVTTASAITNQSITPTMVLNYPGATSTQARGINNPGEIVGTFVCAAACTNPLTGQVSTAGTHGFLGEDILGRGVTLVGSGPGVARSVERALAARGLLNPRQGEGSYRFRCTGRVESPPVPPSRQGRTVTRSPTTSPPVPVGPSRPL